MIPPSLATLRHVVRSDILVVLVWCVMVWKVKLLVRMLMLIVLILGFKVFLRRSVVRLDNTQMPLISNTESTLWRQHRSGNSYAKQQENPIFSDRSSYLKRSGNHLTVTATVTVNSHRHIDVIPNYQISYLRKISKAAPMRLQVMIYLAATTDALLPLGNYKWALTKTQSQEVGFTIKRIIELKLAPWLLNGTEGLKPPPPLPPRVDWPPCWNGRRIKLRPRVPGEPVKTPPPCSRWKSVASLPPPPPLPPRPRPRPPPA